MKKFLLYLLFLCPLCSALLNAQEEKFKAVFIFNFAKYVEWSAQEKQGNFIIGVVGSKEIVRPLEIIASKMKINSQPIVIKYYNSASEVEKCHIVYMAPSKSDELQTLQERFPHSSILFVTDKSNMIQKGSCINFYSKNGEVKFEVSKSNIDKTGLKINPALLLVGKST